MKIVSIVSTGVANLASIIAAFDRLGAETRLIETPDEIANAEYLVLPGVGAFGAAMAALNEKQSAEPLKARITAGKPTLAICLGMQILCSESAESPGVAGLGITPQRVQRLKASNSPVPQMGWNTVMPENHYAYFANSYALSATEISGWDISTFDYEGSYVACMQRGGVLACQFHPELSGAWGQQLIQKWMESASC